MLVGVALCGEPEYPGSKPLKHSTHRQRGLTCASLSSPSLLTHTTLFSVSLSQFLETKTGKTVHEERMDDRCSRGDEYRMYPNALPSNEARKEVLFWGLAPKAGFNCASPRSGPQSPTRIPANLQQFPPPWTLTLTVHTFRRLLSFLNNRANSLTGNSSVSPLVIQLFFHVVKFSM